MDSPAPLTATAGEVISRSACEHVLRQRLGDERFDELVAYDKAMGHDTMAAFTSEALESIS
jgi:hypothetical protein